MNRKLLSLVLAAVFTVSLGTTGFGAYGKYSSSYNSSYGTRNANVFTASIASGEGEEDKTAEQRTGFQIEIPDSNTTLGGNLTAVFKYHGGTLIAAQQADGTFQLYDSYGARFTVNNAGGIWTVTGASLRTSDLAEMEAAGSAENFFRSMGFTNSFLGIADMDDTTTETTHDADAERDDTVVTEVTGKSSKISDGWWQLAIDTLKQGANYSLNISEGTGATGPTLTILENGKQMASYTTDNTVEGVTDSPFGNGSYSGLRQTAQYYYDSHGFMTGYSQAMMEDTETDNGKVSGKWIQNVTKITYDKDGVRTDTSYKLFDWSNDPMGTVNNSKSDIALGGAEVTASNIGQEVSKTYYSANNSALYSYDFTNNNTTFFANNRQSYVKNETGTTVGLYEYSANGVIQAYFNANGTVEGSDEKVGTTTIFDKWGRQLYTATGGGIDDPTGKNAFTNKSYRDQLTAEYYDIVYGNIDYKDLTADFELVDSKVSTANSSSLQNLLNDYKAGKITKDEYLAKTSAAASNESTETNKREYQPKAGTGTAISSFNIYTDQLFKGNAYQTNGFLDMNKVWNAMNGISNTSFNDELLKSIGVQDEQLVKDLTTLLEKLNKAADHIQDSGTNGKGATDEKDMANIAKYLTSADSKVKAAKKALDAEIKKGANADKATVEKLASVYAAVCKTASEMYDRAESIAGIAKFRQEKNGASKKGSQTVSDATLAKFDNIKDRREAASQTEAKAFSYAQNKYANRSGNNASVLAGKLSGLNTSLYGMGYTASDIYKMLKYSHGGKTALASTSIAMSSWDGDNIPDDADTSDVAYQSNSTQNITGSTQSTHVQWSTQSKSRNSSITAAGITFTNTIMFGGAQAYQTQKNVVTNIYEDIQEQVSTESDPAITGQLWSPTSQEDLINMANKLGVDVNDEAAMADLANGFYTVNGQTYAIVAADSVNIMDGNGFQAAEGETIMVAIDKETKNKIESGVASGDRSVMFMGDVRESSTGYLTMAMNASYGGGFVTGAAAIETMKTEIAQKSQAVTQAKDALESGLISQAEYDSIIEASGWVGNNTAENLDKFARGNYSWDENKTATQNLRDAWDILLNF